MSMNQTLKYGISEELNAQALDLPYKGDKVSMVILLPKEVNGIAALQEALTADRLINFEKVFDIRYNKVDVFLPRFKLEDSFSLNDALGGMGMNEAFDSLAADFSGMSSAKNLYISAVVHKAFLEVNEEGSEAAAATAAMCGGASWTPSVACFRADHPFLFFIHENDSGTILFFGKFGRPAPKTDSL